MAVPITVPGDPSSPLTYTVPGSTAFIPRAASANFDGSGAGGDFLPCMKWVAQSGQVIGRFIAPQVAAGSSAEVSWAPFLGSAGVDAIRYDTPNLGDWLQVVTDGAGATAATDVFSYSGLGVGVVAEGGVDMVLGTKGGGNIDIDAGGFIDVQVAGTGGHANGEMILTGGGNPDLTAQGFNTVAFHADDGSGQLSFYADNPIRFVNTGGVTSAVIYMAIIDGNYFSIFKNDLSKEWLRVGSGGIFMPHLPTVNPGVAGQLWRNGNIVTIV